MSSPYKVLGLPKAASRAEIKTQFRKLAFEFHPDKNRGNEDAAQKQFVNLRAAYEQLMSALEPEETQFQSCGAARPSRTKDRSTSFPDPAQFTQRTRPVPPTPSPWPLCKRRIVPPLGDELPFIPASATSLPSHEDVSTLHKTHMSRLADLEAFAQAVTIWLMNSRKVSAANTHFAAVKVASWIDAEQRMYRLLWSYLERTIWWVFLPGAKIPPWRALSTRQVSWYLERIEGMRRQLKKMHAWLEKFQSDFIEDGKPFMDEQKNEFETKARRWCPADETNWEGEEAGKGKTGRKGRPRVSSKRRKEFFQERTGAGQGSKK